MQQPFRYAQQPGRLTMSRRHFVRIVSVTAAAAVATPGGWSLFTRELAAQGVALKELVPAGWVIGAGDNTNQSDGRDVAAIDLVSRQFNTISPETLLKFQS